MIKHTILSIVFLGSFGCVTPPTTDNPTNPEADSPIVFGEQTPAPWGCMQWKKSIEAEGWDC